MLLFFGRPTASLSLAHSCDFAEIVRSALRGSSTATATKRDGGRVLSHGVTLQHALAVVKVIPETGQGIRGEGVNSLSSSVAVHLGFGMRL